MVSKSKVRLIRGLCQKKMRADSDLFLVEGPHMVEELLQWRPEDAEEVFALAEWVDPRDSRRQAALAPPVVRIQPEELAAMSCQHAPNQVLALVRKRRALPPVAPRGALTLALDAVRDPGNLGTIIRTADWFGIRNVVCSPDCAELHNPKVVQATMGGIFRIELSYTDLAAWLPTTGMPVFCTTLDGSALQDIPSPQEGVIVIGNEARGVSDAVRALATQRVTIPRYGHAESLNASVAAGIVMAALCQGRSR
ncbi:MAG: RNA methyltransferase [Chitinophagia bacterium]|nr:RNA methyltransferase [Chitinophagia bacterium]